MGSNNNPYTEGHHYTHFVYDLAVPAGSNFSEQPNFKGRMKIAYINFVLTTDANVANRLIRVGFEKAGTFIPLSAVTLPQAASTAKQYFFFPGNNTNITGADLVGHASLPNAFTMLDEDYLQTSIENIQVGDVISVVNVALEIQPTGRFV